MVISELIYHLISVPPEAFVRQPGQTGETFQQLVGEKYLSGTFVVCTERQQLAVATHRLTVSPKP